MKAGPPSSSTPTPLHLLPETLTIILPMNFFKSVFSSDPDPSDSSSEGKSPSGSPHKPRGNEGTEDVEPAATEHDPNPNDRHNLKTNMPWIGLGTLIKTVASKSESVIQTYRRDLEEFSSGLKKETEAIREVASRAVRDLPSSLEAGASVAQESLETVGQAIDDFGGSVWRGTAEIISEGKGALLGPDSDSEAHSLDLQTPSGGGTTSSSKRYSRFELQVLAMQSDPNTFSEEPEDEEDFRRWMSEFHLEEKEEEIELLCYDNGTLDGLFEKMVPSVVDYGAFWSRYFYKLDKLKHTEDVRANLVKRVISREDVDEDLTWEVEDDEDEEVNQAKETVTNNDIREEEEDDEHIGEDDVSNVENEERIEKVDENKEASNIVHVEASSEKGDADSIELKEEKEPGGEHEISSLDFDTSAGRGNETEPASKLLATNSDDNVPPKSSSETVEPFKDSDISVVSSQASTLEEEDLGWDEIEDLGEHDDKKVSGSSSSTRDEKNLHKRLNVAEDDDDLTWDIEDDD